MRSAERNSKRAFTYHARLRSPQTRVVLRAKWKGKRRQMLLSPASGDYIEFAPRLHATWIGHVKRERPTREKAKPLFLSIFRSLASLRVSKENRQRFTAVGFMQNIILFILYREECLSTYVTHVPRLRTSRELVLINTTSFNINSEELTNICTTSRHVSAVCSTCLREVRRYMP